jgi:hypothetical protein
MTTGKHKIREFFRFGKKRKTRKLKADVRGECLKTYEFVMRLQEIQVHHRNLVNELTALLHDRHTPPA